MATADQVESCPACGTLLTENGYCSKCGMHTEIGRFKLRGTLGTGGFATVYLAEDADLGRQVALKLLHPHLTTDSDFIRRFRDEARAAARLRHRNIVRIFDASQTEDGRPFLVMELLDGTLLSQLISQRAPLPLGETASIVTQLASALDYLHEHALIHRDLKPSNVMIDASGQATLMDFGVARSVLEQSRFTNTGQLFGTPTYMAPELASGGTLGPATDIYSLGIVAYEMLSGRPPFEGNTQRLVYSHIYEQPPPLTNVPPAVAAAVQRALEKEPGKRFQTSGEFASELSAAAPDTSTRAIPLDATIAVPQAATPPAASPPDASDGSTIGRAVLLPRSPEPTIAVGAGEAGRAQPQPPPADAAIVLPPSQTPERTFAVQAGQVPPAPLAAPGAASPAPPRRTLLLAIGGAAALLVLAAAALLALRLHGGRRATAQRAAAPIAATAAPRAATGGAAAPAGAIAMKITSPADAASVNSSVKITVEQTGATIKAATDGDPNAAHFHYFIDRDPAPVLRPGQPIPSGEPDIIHSADSSYTAVDLRPGPHDVWVVLAHTDHTPFTPNVQTKVTFTVVAAADAVQTLAGSGTRGFADGSANAAQFSAPSGVAVDAAGNVYAADAGNSRIRKVVSGGVSTVAGSGAGQFDGPRGIAVDGSGNLYVADTVNNRIRKITPDGTVTTFAGANSPGVGGGGLADGQGTSAQFKSPLGVAVDAGGNVYVADTGNNRIRKITPDGRVTTIAGSGPAGSGGFADGPAASAKLNAPRGVAVDGSGNVYVADTLNQRIRKISPDGTVSTIAGSGDQGTANGAAAAARFSNPEGLAVDGSGDIFVSDNSSFRIREILPSGIVIDYAGTGQEGYADGAAASAKFDFPAGIAVDSSGNLYVADSSNNRLRKITPFKR